MKPIHYIDDPVPGYSAKTRKAKTLPELRAIVEDYALIAGDAVDCVAGMTEADWPEFKRGRASEARGKFAGEEWSEKYGCVILPEIMFRSSIVANTYFVPWGCAYIRLRDEGFIVEEDGRAKWVEK